MVALVDEKEKDKVFYKEEGGRKEK